LENSVYARRKKRRFHRREVKKKKVSIKLRQEEVKAAGRKFSIKDCQKALTRVLMFLFVP